MKDDHGALRRGECHALHRIKSHPGRQTLAVLGLVKATTTWACVRSESAAALQRFGKPRVDLHHLSVAAPSEDSISPSFKHDAVELSNTRPLF